MTFEHPLPRPDSPQTAYELASGTMARACRTLGASEAAARFEPRKFSGGWWSPLFDAVLEVPHA